MTQNISMELPAFGRVGDALGPLLHDYSCGGAAPHECVAAGHALCRANISGCSALELVCRNGTYCKRLYLRGSYVAFGTHDASLQPNVDSCRELSQVARRSHMWNDAIPWQAPPWRPGEWRRRWVTLHCAEHADVGAGLPALGRPLAGALSSRHCPSLRQPGRLTMLSYQSNPSPMLCTFLASFATHGVPLTLLGWDAHAPPVRRVKTFYMADKLYSVLRLLAHCRPPHDELQAVERAVSVV